MIPEALSAIANHLWQSTLFSGAAALLAGAVRRYPARVRHRIWVAASLKFLVPFSLLMDLGSQMHWRAARPQLQIALAAAADQVSQPFTPAYNAIPAAAPAGASVIPTLLWIVWACGVIVLACRWWTHWRRIGRAVRTGCPIQLALPIRAISSPSFLEPGVFGVFRPVLLLPEGIFDHLSPEQWKSVLAHELCHVRRRDNLIAAIHMLVESLFWFHPLTWWIGKQICQERERACDEEVVTLGNEPHVYARGILKVCERYLESPIPCVAGVSGSNLRRRIELILNARIVKNLNGATKALLAAAGLGAIAAPIALGLLHGAILWAQTVPPDLIFEVASMRPASPSDRPGFRETGIPGPADTDPGRFTAHTSLMNLILTAYDIPLYRLEQDERFLPVLTVEAKMPPNTTREQFNVMLQNLLKDRMGLKAHWTSKDVDMYVMTLAKGGPKLKPAAPGAPAATGDDGCGGPNCKLGSDGFPVPPPGNGTWYGIAPGGKMGMRWHDQTADEIAHTIGSRSLDGPVTDATGLTGKYDYTIFWSNPATTAALGFDPAVEPDGPSIFEAVQEQLGLKIEKRKGPVQMLVVDHVEKKPAEN